MPADAAPPVPSGAASARFVRQRTLPGFGIAAQQRLLDARVVVVGAGGLGSIVIPALAAAGVGTLVIVDDDTVDVTNLHRQTIHDAVDVGERKAASAAARVAALSPDTRVEVRSERLTTTNAARIAEGADLLVDASDNFPTRYLLDDLGTLAGIPVVWGSVSQYAGQVGVAAGPDAPSYRDLFPVPPAPDAVVSCEVGGVLPTVCGAIGALMAGEAIKLLTGVGEPLIGRVAIFDSLTTRFREVEFGRDPEAEPVTGLIDYELFCGAGRGDSEADTGRADAGHSSAGRSSTGEVTTVTPTELAAELRAGSGSAAPPVILDVREPWEIAVAAFPDARPLDPSTPPGIPPLAGLDPDAPLVVVCHHGIRSDAAARRLVAQGFTSVRNLAGGIDAWAREVDPDLARY